VGEGRAVRAGGVPLALFRVSDGEVRAIEGRCPHRGGPLADGILAGERVICPLHGLVVGLADGSAEGPGGCGGRVRTFAVRLCEGSVLLEVEALRAAAAAIRAAGCATARRPEDRAAAAGARGTASSAP
jgi:nitrite reductase (NADH) small subunit